MSYQSYKDTLHFLDAHINILDHTSVEHTRWHMPTTTLLLQFLQAPEDDSFTMGETILHIWQRVTRITVWHIRLLHIGTPHKGYQ
jgi:hypothetical protein